MTEKRFELLSIHFKKFEVEIYDNLRETNLNLTVYELIELLNRVAQSEYDMKMLRADIIEQLNKVMLND